MNQVSRPMQIVLAGALVFALVWFAVLRPKAPAEDVAATPVTPAETTPGAAQSGVGKIVETAKEGAADADSAVKAREAQTGETTPTTPATKATTPAAAATPKATTPAASAGAKAETSKVTAAQKRANKVITKIQGDLKKRRAVVVLVWSKTGKEDKIVRRRLQKNINRRNGKVVVYYVAVKEVGRYDGLLGGLSLGQIPSTVVIAPNNQAKVLGGLVSTARIDRLTSSATLTKPVAAAKQ